MTTSFFVPAGNLSSIKHGARFDIGKALHEWILWRLGISPAVK